MTASSGQSRDSLIEWSYAGPGAPENWASLSPYFAACANGRQQSPIDITGYQAGGPSPISFSYGSADAALRNDGRQVHADCTPGNTAMLGGREFQLISTHFHSPSEHLVNGESFAAELHLVHSDSDGRLAVVGVLFTLGAPNPVAQSILDAAASVGETASTAIPLTDSLPTDLSYYRYDGSKTTPPLRRARRLARPPPANDHIQRAGGWLAFPQRRPQQPPHPTHRKPRGNRRWLPAVNQVSSVRPVEDPPLAGAKLKVRRAVSPPLAESFEGSQERNG